MRVTPGSHAAYRPYWIRLLLEFAIILFVYIATAFKVWTEHWTDSHRTLFLQAHIALLLFEEGAANVRHVPFDNIIRLTSPMIGLLMVLQFWGLIADAFMVINTGEDLHDYNTDSEFIIKITLVLIVTVIDVWRTTDILIARNYYQTHQDRAEKLIQKQASGQRLTDRERSEINDMRVSEEFAAVTLAA